MKQLTAEVFLRDVQEHIMAVRHVDGLYRHIHFSKPQNSNLWFDLITLPGCLTIHGDMGTWTFSRVEDMLTFFRSARGLQINPSYWAEKLQHGLHCGRDGAKVFDAEVFAESLLGQLKDHYGFTGKKLAEVVAAVKEEVLTEEYEYDLKRAAYDFRHTFHSERLKPVEFYFEGTEIPDGKVYAYHFLWCLYAIVWGISKWDEQQEMSKS